MALKRSSEQRRNKSLHVLIKQQLQLDDFYYVNSAAQAAKAQITSLEELKTLYISNKKEQIKKERGK